MHFKRPPNSCFAIKAVNVGLKTWQKNVDMQPVFNEYKTVTYMCQNFSKIVDQCSQAMKQAAKETFDNNIYHHDPMKTIVKTYLTNKECSV